MDVFGTNQFRQVTIKKLKGEELTALAQEIREFLIEKISNTGVIWHPIWVLWS